MNEWMKHFGSYFKNSIYLWDFSMLLLLSCFSHVRLCTTPWTAAHQAPLSLVFSRQEHWTELPFPSPMCACMISHFSHVRLCATPWTAAHQAPLSMGFSRQEYWSGLPFPSPRLNILQPDKGHMWQSHSLHHTQWWKVESFPFKMRNKTRVPTLATPTQHYTGSPNQGSQISKRNKGHTNLKGTSETVCVLMMWSCT